MTRAERLSVLAKASEAELEAEWARLGPAEAAWPRPPEPGMIMLEGKAAGTGQRFCLGQMTVTRATCQLGGHTGVGYVQGHDGRRAELMALLDALAEGGADLDVAPMAARQRAEAEDRARAAAATKVEFFTMARTSGLGGGG